MGYSIGFDVKRDRFIGYGVPAICEHPDCTEKIDRGMGYSCNGFYSDGCGLCFCSRHLHYIEEHDHPVCERCANNKEPFDKKPDTTEWMKHQLKDPTWKDWRKENPKKVKEIKLLVNSK